MSLEHSSDTDTDTDTETDSDGDDSGLCYKGLCLNSGTCIDLDSKSFFCLCQYGFTGSRCEQSKPILLKWPRPVPLFEIFSFNCRLFASLVPQKKIVCQFTSETPQTEITVSLCGNNVCENQGTCLESKNTFICLCKFGYFGNNCQHSECIK